MRFITVQYPWFFIFCFSTPDKQTRCHVSHPGMARGGYLCYRYEFLFSAGDGAGYRQTSPRLFNVQNNQNKIQDF
ncbi:Protein of unknown function [Pyronema omphalodes CBS 100304]|uniref:Uncharacterized protein n=1 Tax=Pyronema omphalodes (strain CBS 100304) TaxID=1076935 RepID=U4L9B2_PYROM|nr:Protein of unknown function [Pyronema omphalodes CBS 100304]